MSRRFSSLFIAMALVAMCLFSATVNAVNVTINPGSFVFSGDKASVITRTAAVTNQESFPVHLNVTVNATGLAVIPVEMVLNPSSSMNLVMTYVLPVNISSGTILLSLNGTNISVSVSYTEGQMEETVQAPVEIFPNPPVSGADIVIFFTGDHRGLRARGFLSVNGYVYAVDMDGFDIVSLDRNAYGTATLRLFGSSVVESDSTKVFDIQRGSGKDVRISMPNDATVGSIVTATIVYGTDPLMNQEVAVENPDGDEETYVTNNQGKIEFTVDVVGRWRLMVVAEGQTATGSVTVGYGTLALGIAEETYRIGDTVTVVTEPGAVVDVYIDNEYQTEFTASSEGFASLTLTGGGNYRLVGKLDNMRGEYTFSIPSQAQIQVLDSTTRAPVSKLETNRRYIVEVTDEDGNPLSDAEAVWIQNPLGTKELLTLTDGSGFWTPLSLGAYTLTVDDTASASGNAKYILIRPAEAEFGWLTIAVGIAVFVLVLMLILTLLARSKGLPLGMVLKSIFKRRGRIELPTDD